ncbi:MAG TPA: type IV-A pilus assembly ATPase PilB, partial [Legionella sp.]|nr:type IV-A pilus assembly ATPase PilB [Legionella sp.]
MDMQKAPQSQGIAQVLALDHLLSQERIVLYQARALNQKMSLLQYIAHENILNTKQMASSIAQFFQIPLVDLDTFDLTSIPSDLVSLTLIISHRVLPLFIQDNQLYLATDDPSQHDALQEIQFHTGFHVTPRVVDAHQLTAFITQLIHQQEHQGLSHYAANTKRIEYPHPPTENISSEEEPVVLFVKRILLEAIEQNASDIHFEPYKNDYRIRYRQDGMLITVATPPPDLSTRIAARLKVMAHLDTSERRIPQDGRFRMQLTEGLGVDFRISSCPTLWGEKIVLRLLDVTTVQADIDVLGFLPHQREHFLKAIARPEGMILVTGPTGSGKTVTLYAALNALNTMDRNVSSVEDPVEINMHGINQVNINPKAGLTFAGALRAFLRQDPDVIMIGE